MTSIIKAAAEFEDALREMEKDIAHSERMRKDFIKDLDTATQNEIGKFLRSTVDQKKIATALRSVETALANSKASFERMAAKADKDLVTITKHVPAQPLNARHPFVIKKLIALQKVQQQLGFVCVELEKMSEAVNWKLEKENPWGNNSVFMKGFSSFGNYGMKETENFQQLKQRLDFVGNKLEQGLS